MRIFHIKSIILGIGLGIVLTAVAGMLYTAMMAPVAGLNYLNDLTEEQIEEISEKYDLVKRTSLILDSENSGNESSGSENSKPDNNGNAENKTAGETTQAATQTTTQTTTQETSTNKVENNAEDEQGNTVKVIFEIKSGEASETIARRLYKAGLIENEKDFLILVDKLGLATKIQIGEYEIDKGTSMNEIARRITR